jgi:hypothetical protein
MTEPDAIGVTITAIIMIVAMITILTTILSIIIGVVRIQRAAPAPFL